VTLERGGGPRDKKKNVLRLKKSQTDESYHARGGVNPTWKGGGNLGNRRDPFRSESSFGDRVRRFNEWEKGSPGKEGGLLSMWVNRRKGATNKTSQLRDFWERGGKKVSKRKEKPSSSFNFTNEREL